MKTILFLFLLFPLFPVWSQSGNIRLETIPYPLEIHNQLTGYKMTGEDLAITSPGKTNLFNNPAGTSRIHNAPMILFQPRKDFTLKTRVSGDLQSVYDVVALVLYQDEDLWAKLCYENSVEQEPTIVSVVTRTYSDDCNSIPAGDHAWLSVTRKGNEFSFFYSADNKEWKMIRHFHLGLTAPLKVGFAVHGSRGEGLTGYFSTIEFEEFEDEKPTNLRRDN